MSFGDLVSNEKGVPHAHVRCVDCINCVQKPIPVMAVFGRPEGSFPVEHVCAEKGLILDSIEMTRMCSSFERERPEPEDKVREYCVTFSGRGRAVIKARNEDEAWDLAEGGMVDMGDFTELVIEDVEVNT